MSKASVFQVGGSTPEIINTTQQKLDASVGDAKKLAINPEDSQFTLSDTTTTGFSALHHKEKAIDAQTSSETAKTLSETAQTASEAARDLSQQYRDTALSHKNGAETAETNAASSATNAGVSETNAASSETDAANSALTAIGARQQAEQAEIAAAASETNAAASETAASASETNAATSETNAAASETNSAASASAALASQNAAAASETAADADAVATAADSAQTAIDRVACFTSAATATTSKNNAATSETNAATSAGSAAASATAASTSETNAATSETNAATSETNAAASAAVAADPWALVSGTNNIKYDAGDVIIQSPVSTYRSLDFKSTTYLGFAQDDAQVVSNPDQRGVVIEAGTLTGSHRGSIPNGGVLALRDDDSYGTSLTFHAGNGTRTGIITGETNGDLRLVGKQSSGANGVLDISDNVYIRYPDDHVVKETLFTNGGNVSSATTTMVIPNSTSAAGTGGNAWYAYKLSDHDAPVKKVEPYRLNLELNVSGRFVENSDDPGFRAYLQYYRADTQTWTNIGSTDTYARGRYADRGTGNYMYGVVNTHHGGLWGTTLTRFDAPSSTYNQHLLLRIQVQGVGGTGSDDLDVYWHSLKVTELAYLD